MGYQRDGYLYTFRYAPYPGRRDTLTIEGDARGTRFYVNGRLRDDLSPRKLYFDGGKASINYMSTLVFPLGTAGEFQSRISQFKVENFIKKD
jgi:hexosaminidase